MVEPELLLRLLQQALELGSVEEGDGDYVPRPVLAYVHREVALGYIQDSAIVADVLLSEARTPPHNLPYHGCLG